MKAKLLQNIKMFIVGAILLIISFTYIKGHPGEWNSFVPSLQMLYYKGEVFFYKILGKDAKSLEIKQQFNKIYTELNYLVESSECADTELVDLIKKQQELLKNMDIFYNRFWTQQFKRSCMPDGVKVGSVSLSPRGDLRMPSDATSKIWIEE